MKFFDFLSSIETASAPKKVVGIDIGAAAMKVVELEDRNGVVTLTTYGELTTGQYSEGGVVGQAVSLTPPLERQALTDILKEAAVTAKNAVLAIPLNASFVTVVAINAAADEDISTKVRVDARKYIPLPITDVTLDWAELGRQGGDGTTDGTRDVLIAAIQNEALKRFIGLLSTSDFKNPPTEIECFSSLRALRPESAGTVGVIDIGAAMSKLYLAHDGLLERMHRVPTAGFAITEKIAKERQISLADAEALKRNTPPAEVPFVQKMALQTLVRVIREFKQVMTDYERRTGRTVAKLKILGGGALISGVVESCAHELGLPASPATPFECVAYPAFMEDTLKQIGPTFAPALGAALREFE